MVERFALIPVHGSVLITVKDILTIVMLSEEYDFDHQLLSTSLATWLNNQLSDIEILEFASMVATPPSYTQKDFIDLKDKIVKWRDTYCKQGTKEP